MAEVPDFSTYDLTPWELDPVSLRVSELRPGVKSIGEIVGNWNKNSADVPVVDWYRGRRLREATDVSPDMRPKLVRYMVRRRIRGVETIDQERLGEYL